jgi:hypothetical protein
MSGATPLLPLYTFVMWTGTACVYKSHLHQLSSLHFIFRPVLNSVREGCYGHQITCVIALIQCSILVGDSDDLCELGKWMNIFSFACFHDFISC